MNAILLSWLQWTDPPNWTEFWGFWLSLLGTAAAVFAAVRLLVKNKEIEAAIIELSKIAKLNEEALIFQKKIRIDEIQPHFVFESVEDARLDKIVLTIINKGGKATSLDVILEESSQLIKLPHHPTMVRKGEAVDLEIGIPKNNVISSLGQFSFHFEYYDADYNLYRMQWERTPGGVYTPYLGELVPKEIEPEVGAESK